MTFKMNGIGRAVDERKEGKLGILPAHHTINGLFVSVPTKLAMVGVSRFSASHGKSSSKDWRVIE